MRTFETKIQELKTAVLTEVARLTWEDRLQTGTAILDIPEKIIPGPTATLRCCIYKERAIINSRVKLAMGGDKSNPCLVEVLPIACDECPVTEITVGPSCRGCLATRCVHACPKDAITIVNHRACIDHEKCISCGRCVSACQYSAILKTQRPCEKGCPAKAISMGPDRKASIDVSQCIACGNCVYQCPFGAIQDKSFITDAIHMIMGAEHWGYKTYAVLAPSIVGQFAPASYGQVVAGLKKLGFNGVAEVALGADMVADRESEELVEKGMLCSSCCPGFVGYIKKKHPEMENLISRTPSPMVMIGLHIKEKDPDAKVIFIGPCTAKKGEAQKDSVKPWVDCVMTFQELQALIDSRDFEVSELEESHLDNASYFGRVFARSGGVSDAVQEALKEQGIDFTVKPAVCDGIEAACGVRPRIKWTNDIVLEGKKLCGILTEMGLENEINALQYLVTGIGVNVNQRPEDFSPDVRPIAASLFNVLGRPVRRSELAVQIIRALDRMYSVFPQGKADYLARYRADCLTPGNRVQLITPASRTEATALSIDDEFRLVVEYDDGRREALSAGEVSVRGMYGYV